LAAPALEDEDGDGGEGEGKGGVALVAQPRPARASAGSKKTRGIATLQCSRDVLPPASDLGVEHAGVPRVCCEA
jgi:hypothetical protein